MTVAACYVLATGVRTGGRPEADLGGAVALALGAGALQVVANIWFEVYWRDWGVAALEDLLALVKASAVVALALLSFNLASSTHFIPNGAVVTGAGLVIVAESALKLKPRWRQIVRGAFGRVAGEKVIVVGAGRTGQLLARDLADGAREHRVTCFVDDDARKWGTYVRGVIVAGGVDDLPELIARHQPSLVVIAMTAPPGALVRRVVERCRGLNVRVRAVRGFSIRDGGDTAPLRALSIEELLERMPVDLEQVETMTYLSGQTVLVTGAAGSIGRELCRQLSRLNVGQLLLLDMNESGLHELVAELGQQAPVELLLGDIRDRRWLGHVLRTFRPRVVFHAAAYKHVPIIERTPYPAISVNVAGTANVLASAAEAQVQRLVFISSDKAVSPTNVLGITKRFGELLTIAYANVNGLNYSVVRFGNVLASSGSVVTIFSRQIDAGGPVTVTHPEATRYFMTLREAAGLVIQAGGMAGPGDLLLLDMGTPILVVDLARKMITLRGLRTPADVEITFTGLRPGEKLREELLFPDEVAAATEHPRIMRVLNSTAPRLHVLHDVANRVAHCLEDGDGGAAQAVALLRGAIGGHGLAETTPEELSAAAPY